jgi:hypothetical protein
MEMDSIEKSSARFGLVTGITEASGSDKRVQESIIGVFKERYRNDTAHARLRNLIIHLITLRATPSPILKVIISVFALTNY